VLDSQVNKDVGASVFVHETLLNSLVARAGLKGLKTTDQEMRKLIAPYELNDGNSDSDSAGHEPVLGLGDVVTDIEFDADDPLTIRIVQDLALVTLRVKFKPAGQDVLPPLAVTIEYRTSIEQEKLVVTPGKVQVVSRDESDKSTATAIALKVMTQAIQASLRTLAVDRTLPASFWPFSGEVPQVTGIRSQDGWAVLTIN
jgi:hypothetical protein